jgi:hypothetical protein
MMKYTKSMNLSFAALLLSASVLAVSTKVYAQSPFSETFTEKWPPSATQAFATLTDSNAISEYFRANFGKLGELAANRLDACLKSNKCRLKVSTIALARVKSIFENVSLSQDQKAKAFVQAVEDDLGVSSSAPSPQLGIVSKYSASYGVSRLTWLRQSSRISCIKDTHTCPGGQVVIAGQLCPVIEIRGGQQYLNYVFPTISRKTDTIDTEWEYIISRNGKVLARFPEVKKVLPLSGGSTTLFDFLNLSLAVLLPFGSSLPAGYAGPFYDLDPQFAPLSSQLTYTITAQASACGYAYDNYLVGAGRKLETIVVDGNLDGVPDYYPIADWENKLPHIKAQRSAILSVLLN